MTIAVGAIFKNEDEYVLEWLAFHRVVGFTHFYVADNGSNDMTREILTALAESEPITLVDFPDVPERRPQLPAYNELVQLASGKVDLLAIVDSDEFVLPPPGSSSVVPSIESLFADPDVGAVALNWVCYGSSGHLFHDEGLVIERFKRRSSTNFSVNQHYKMIVRPGYVSAWDSPHHASLMRGRAVDAHGNELVYRDGFRNSLSKQVIWDGLRVNHYVVKSLEEFLVRKSPKGSASKVGRVKHRQYFELHDKNNDICTDMDFFVPMVKAEVSRLQKLLSASAEKPTAPRAWRQWVAHFRSALSGE